MPIDASIALGYKPTDGLQALSSVLNIQGQQQNLQAQRLQMQGAQQQNEASAIKLNETKALQPFLADHRNYTDEAGNVDQAKLYRGIMSLAPTTGAERIQQLGAMQQQMTQAESAILGLNTEKRTAVGNILSSVDGTDPEVAHKTFDVIAKMHPELADPIKLARGMYDSTPKEGRADLVKSFARAVLPQPTQQEMNTPSGVQIGNGQQTAFVSTKPGTSVPVGQDLPGTRVQQQLPPGTPVMGRDEAGNPTPGYLGPQPGRPGSPEAKGSATTTASIKERIGILQGELDTATDPADREALKREIARLQPNGGSGFVASGLPVGQAENISNNVTEMNRHFGALQDQSTGVQLAQGLTGNIKALASGAATGTEAGRKAYLVGLLNTLHLGNQSTGDIQRDTDLLEKNMAQLGLNTPASTDAMRTLITAARPHSSMSKEAIEEAADQVASQVKANMAIRNALSSYKMMGDAAGYQAARQKIEGIADPRAWQYESMPPAQRRAFMGKLTVQDRSELISKVQQLEQMGLLK